MKRREGTILGSRDTPCTDPAVGWEGRCYWWLEETEGAGGPREEVGQARRAGSDPVGHVKDFGPRKLVKWCKQREATRSAYV